MGDIRAIVVLSNAISAALAVKTLEHDGRPLSEVALFMGRKFAFPEAKQFGELIEFGVDASLTLRGQVRTAGYYTKAAARIKALLAAGKIADIYVPNIDNLLTNHLLQWIRRGGQAKLTVLAEGLMNYQEIDLDDRAGWRWRVKPLVSAMLGLRYRIPASHLSGAYEPECTRVVSFAVENLKAPAEKVQIFPFPRVAPPPRVDPAKVLVVITGIAQWMSESDFSAFADRFGRWFATLGMKKIVVKPHPFYPSGGIEARLPPHEVMKDARSLEALAPEIDAGVVVGYCSTALVTLKLMRPDLRCIDFGSDFYCAIAYHGDYSVVNFLAASGIEIAHYRSKAA